MSEVVAPLLLAAIGWVLLSGRGTRGDLRLAAALPVGVAAFVTVELVLLVAVPSLARPWVALGVATVVALAAAARVRPTATPGERRGLLVAAVVALATIAVAVVLPVVNVTVDSFRYLSLSTMLARGEYTELVAASVLQNRGLATPAVHGLAPTEPGYLRSLGPLVGLATLATLAVVVRRAVDDLGRPLAMVATVAVVALLATNHRVVFSALYVNSHALVAVWVLLLAVVAWWVVRDPRLATGPFAAVVAVCATALVAARPEGVLLALVVLAPVVLAPGVPRPWRASVLAAVGAAAVLWHAGVLLRAGGPEEPFDPQIVGLAALGAAVVLVALALPLVDAAVARVPAGHLGALVGAHALLWLGLAVLVAREPRVLLTSLDATLRNVTADGLWGASLWTLLALLVVAVVLVSVPRSAALWFPLLSFLPLGLLLALLREGAYRVGPGDSFNRMLVHVVPLAAAVLGVSIGAEVRERWRPRLASLVDDVPSPAAGPGPGPPPGRGAAHR